MAVQNIVITFKHNHDCAHAGREVTRNYIASAGEFDPLVPRCSDTRFLFSELEIVSVTTREV